MVSNPTSKASTFASSASRPLSKAPTYDFIVVGGGTAGCILAHRLSANPAHTVLLLEAGQNDASYLFSRIPSAFTLLFKGSGDWNFHTEQEPGVLGRSLYWPRGKMLGGCSAINAMIYHRGAWQDYDRWAEMTGDETWGWKYMVKYFKKTEQLHQHAHLPLSPQEQEEHGVDGEWPISHPTQWAPISTAFVQACMETGISLTPDVNTSIRGTLGVVPFQTSVYGLERVTSRRAMLTPNVLQRRNLVIATQCHVVRILFDETGEKPRAIGVEFVNQGQRYVVKSRKEVVLTAGAVQSPHLLLLSGIGPKEKLETWTIPVIRDLPGVGASLYDHITSQVLYTALPNTTYNQVDRFPYMISNFMSWFLNHPEAVVQSNVAETACFIRVKEGLDGDQAQGERVDRAMGDEAPHVEILCATGGLIEHGQRRTSGDMFTLVVVLLNPRSHGRITLASPDPMVAPRIEARYFSDERDVDVMVAGIQQAMRIAEQPSLKNRMPGGGASALYRPKGLRRDDVDGIRRWIRESAETLYHPTSTCKMGRERMSVVDPRLCVHGVDGLRIADASIMPYIVAGHTMAPVMAIAEKAADLIQQDHHSIHARL